jgi:ADP-ribosyl-[dinitrogen reductase] hydrolase
MREIKEIIQAGAIGDAFGYQVEFQSMQQIQILYGEKGIKYHASSEKDASDDTQMTLFLWDAVKTYIKENNTFSLEDFTKDAHKAFKNWYETQINRYSALSNNEGLMGFKELYKRQAPGNTCMSALHNNTNRSVKFKINDSKGCGSVMRVAPLLVLKEHYKLTSEELFDVSAHQAAITHGNDEGMSATAFFTVLLDDLANGQSFNDAYTHSLKVTKKQKPNGFINYIEDVYKKSLEPVLLTGNDLEEIIGGGWIADEAVGVALYCAMKTNSFAQCLELSTNHSGDSDSTASMAAQLYAAKNGLAASDILFLTDLDNVVDYLSQPLVKKKSLLFKN